MLGQKDPTTGPNIVLHYTSKKARANDLVERIVAANIFTQGHQDTGGRIKPRGMNATGLAEQGLVVSGISKYFEDESWCNLAPAQMGSTTHRQ